MTLEKAQKLIQPFLEKCHKDNDCCVVVHFSREEDKYQGTEVGVDYGDVLIIIKDLIKLYGLDPKVIANMDVKN